MRFKFSHYNPSWNTGQKLWDLAKVFEIKSGVEIRGSNFVNSSLILQLEEQRIFLLKVSSWCWRHAPPKQKFSSEPRSFSFPFNYLQGRYMKYIFALVWSTSLREGNCNLSACEQWALHFMLCSGAMDFIPSLKNSS